MPYNSPEKRQAYEIKNREKRLAKKRECAKNFRLANPELTRTRKREWRRNWRKTLQGRAKAKVDMSKPKNKIAHALRHRMWMVLHGKKKMQPTLSYLGCTRNEFRLHLETLFKPGMDWTNHGIKGWHIDHKRPLASFCFIREDGLVDEDELRRAMHYTNLQPLWYWENASKGASLIA